MQRKTNPFEFSDDNKRYHTWNYHLRSKFGGKVVKIPLDAGFTCPNRDGAKGTGGCVFCSAAGSGEFAGDRYLSLSEQFESVKAKLSRSASSYIPYFQAYTNTYAPVSVLKDKFEPFVGMGGVVGLAVATRADAVTEEIADYLKGLSEKTYLTVELGLQTAFDKTAERINRCHTYAEFLEGYYRLVSRGINVCVHIIDGLPGETAEMMIKTAERVAALRPHSVKIHLLHVLKNTKLAEWYVHGDFELLTREEYVRIVCEQIKRFPPETIIQRLTGDGAAEDLIGPDWSRNKIAVLNSIDKLLYATDSFQGMLFSGEEKA